MSEASTGDEKRTVTREEIYGLVWTEPMLKVAKRFDVSSSYLARVCARLNVPRPERGYWAKLAVGKAPSRPALPDARPGDEMHWALGGGTPDIARPLPRPPVASTAPKVTPARRRLENHPLVLGVKPLFEAGRTSYDSEYLKPAKKLLPDLVVSRAGLDKALGFANELFCALEANGHRVVIAPNGEQFRRADVDERETPPRKDNGHGRYDLWRPLRITAAYIGTVAIGLTVIELSENVEVRYVNGKYVRESEYVPPKRRIYQHDTTWTTRKDYPTRRLCLQAYSPYPVASWTRQWREERQKGPLDVARIVKDLEGSVSELVRLIEEGKRRAELEHQRWQAQAAEWERQEQERRVAKARKDSRDDLLAIIEDWAGTKRLEAFFGDAAQRLEGLPEEERARMEERLRRARELIGSSDTLSRFHSWKLPEER